MSHAPKPLLTLAGVVLLLGCPQQTTSPAPPGLPLAGVQDAGAGACDAYGSSRRVGLVPSELSELSGLAASRTHPAMYWAHNDSGNKLELFAIREDGTVLGRVPVTGTPKVDVEDLAVGPCAAGSERSCVYLADIGDNQEQRQSVAVYRLPEPSELSVPVAPEIFTFSYPGGPRNAESLVVDPRSAQLYVVTKTFQSLGEVFRVELPSTPGVATAVRLGELHAPRDGDRTSTGADAHPSGTRLLLRTYSHVWEFVLPGATGLEQVFTAPPREVPGASQAQSEAVAYAPDGKGYLLGSEGPGEGLFRVECRP